jgi:anti-anti-sigma regulatory factor
VNFCGPLQLRSYSTFRQKIQVRDAVSDKALGGNVADGDQKVVLTQKGENAILCLPDMIRREHAAEVWQSAQELTQSGRTVEIHFNQAPVCDVSVLQVLLALDVALRKEGRELKATGVSNAMQEQLASVGCEGFLNREGK